MIKKLLLRLWNDDDAGHAVEYGLMTGMIAIALIGAIATFKTSIVGAFTRLSTNIETNTK